LCLAQSTSGIERGDEVIGLDYTIIATPSVVRWANARVSPRDVDSSTLCMDLGQARVPKSTRALMHVSINGRYGEMGEITNYCRDHDIRLGEDARQAFESKWNGKFLGTFGDVGTFSFTPA
jgi:perosamine synthetase